MTETRLPLEPGKLDRLVTVYALTDSNGGSGFPVETRTPSVFANVWMMREHLKGQERFQDGQISTKYDSKWLMPYRADMDPDLVDVPKSFQIKWEGRYFDITHAEHVGRKEAIQLFVVASTVTT